MKVTLESTSRIVEFNGVKARVWEGETAGGIRCYALIAQITHHKDDDGRREEFLRDLQEATPPTSRAIECFPLRMFID